jgi:hypothetical protein
MSAYTTLTVTRSEAIEMVLERLSLNISNERLEELLFDLIGKENLYNYTVTDDKRARDNDDED